jgi:diguanylate cyclase (GGDEF)-like protein
LGNGLSHSPLAFLFPGGAIVAVLLLAASQPELAILLASLSPYYPYTLVIIALLLGWRYERSRLFFAALLIGVSCWLLQQHTPPLAVRDRLIGDAIATLLPLNLAVLAVLKERGIFTWHGGLRWCLFLVQPLIVWLLLHYNLEHWLSVFSMPLSNSPLLAKLDVSQPALLALLLALGITLYQPIRRHTRTEHDLFWALLLCGYALLGDVALDLALTLLGSAVLVLLIGALELSYIMAYHDELTLLPGRRALNLALLKLSGHYTIAMLDVDHFKRFNDRYGHDLGDEVLKMVAAQMARIGGGGKPFRYGGEEFTLVFPGKRLAQALPYLERLCHRIATTAFTVRSPKRPKEKPQEVTVRGTQTLRITVSIGVADRDEQNPTPQTVLTAADQALYRAKNSGRNRVAL